MATIYKKGDKVVIQGKAYPGVVINVTTNKYGCRTYSVRTEDNRSLVDVTSDIFNVCKDETLKYVEKKLDQIQEDVEKKYMFSLS